MLDTWNGTYIADLCNRRVSHTCANTRSLRPKDTLLRYDQHENPKFMPWRFITSRYSLWSFYLSVDISSANWSAVIIYKLFYYILDSLKQRLVAMVLVGLYLPSRHLTIRFLDPILYFFVQTFLELSETPK